MAQDRLKGRKTLQVANFLDEFEKDDIKKDVDIVRLFQHFGVNLTRKGKSFSGNCPWHDDKSPSLSVDRDKGLYNCFGCGESGDIFTLTEKMKGLGFRESVAYLKDFAGRASGIPTDVNSLTYDDALPKNLTASRPRNERRDVVDLKTRERSAGEETGRDAEPEKRETKVDSTGDISTPLDAAEAPSVAVSASPDMSLSTVADYYHKRLFDSPDALRYLESRGFADTRLFVRFQIGFADGSILEKLTDTQKTSLMKQGIITDRGKEHFAGCITIPIFDDMDMVVGIYGRSINPKAKIPHLYLRGKHRGVFNRKASKVYDEIIFTESIIDALSLIFLGFKNTQSIYGTNGFTDEHLTILKDDRVKTVILAFDNDEAGEKASVKLKEALLSEGFSVKSITPSKVANMFPEHPDSSVKDWNEYLTAGGTPAEFIPSSAAGLSDLKKAITEAIDTAEVFTPEHEDKSFKAEKDHMGYLFTINGITYRVTGAKEIFISNLRVNIKAALRQSSGTDADTGLKYYDNLDLYSARSRSGYAGSMGRTLDIEPNRIEKDLIAILEYLEQERDRHLWSGSGKEKETALTAEERELGMRLLTNPNMFTEIVEDMDILGYVGENLNKQLMYIAASSRKLEDPVSVMVVSESASGKSFLIDTVARLIPPDEVISVTSLSEQALNYMEDMSHKFVSLGEIVHSETIEHQIREMLSKKELTRLVTIKEPRTGKLVTKMSAVPAIVSLAMSGTRYEMNPENTSRCFVVNADESREQTRRIHVAQWTKEYSVKRKNQKKKLVPEIIRKHHAAQKLLQPITIENVFGEYLDFPNILMRTRRDNKRFVDLIACVSYLRQYQKEKKYDESGEPYIEFDLVDYEIAYSIMIKGVLSSSLLEIPRGAIDLYEYFRELARKQAKKENIEAREVSLTQREIREYTGLNQVWVKRHMKILLDYEYITLARGGKARSKGHYQLREDVPMEAVNLSMIPTPDELKKKLQA